MRLKTSTKLALAGGASVLYFSTAVILKYTYVPPEIPRGDKIFALHRPFSTFGKFAAHVKLPPYLSGIADTPDQPNRSPVIIYEGVQRLGPGHVGHGEIAEYGHGRFSHWQDQAVFSSTDGTSPNQNGREYWAVLPEDRRAVKPE